VTKQKTKFLLGAATLVAGVMAAASAIALFVTQHEHILRHFFRAP